jgi:GNAT superfamily N-acetyltransferase
VHPDHRRRGAGRALVEAIEELALADGRTVVHGYQMEVPEERGRSAGRVFAEAVGYSLAQVNPRRDLFLPVAPGRLRELAARCAPHTAGYRMHAFAGPWPERFVADRAELGAHMSTDAPTGDLSVDPEVWSAARVRAHERLVEREDREVLSVAAEHEASGRVVAFTELCVPRGAPEVAYQQDTIVMPDHRGHRLGLAVKVANLAALVEDFPRTRRVVTWNAEDNPWMIAVNDALGCVVVAESLAWEKQLGARPQGALGST